MFDIGFSEMLVIGVVALVVIGPERLPGVARTAGHLIGRFRRYVADVKSDIHQEIQLAEFKQMHEQMKDAAQSFETSVRTEADLIGADLRAAQPSNSIAPPAGSPSLENALAEAEKHRDTFDDLPLYSQTNLNPAEVHAETSPPPEVDPNQLNLFPPNPAVEKHA